MLFKVQKIQLAETKSAGQGVADSSDHVAAPSMKLQDVTHLVDHGRTVHWVSEGDWSMHQLLQKLLELTGPADVFISSYAFSELPARTIADMKATGTIRKLFCVLDSRIDVRSASALTLIKNTADKCKLTHTHAKVTVIRNDQWFLVVVGSANYTTNVRYEAGIISTDSTVASFHQKWIQNELTR
jgi:hypothetical protein